ncbi:MAG TPA: hypothetical protein DCS09_06615 [Porphyromonadaceae bacterium]|nr:hypothetical protein [Porphyromonadaceae bacterium]
MNIEKLVSAAKEIERLRNKSKERTEAWLKLAADAKSGNFDRKEIDRRKQALDVSNVVNFDDAINDLSSALHSNKKRTAADEQVRDYTGEER